MSGPGARPTPRDGVPRITRDGATVVVAFVGPIAGADVPQLCERLRTAVGRRGTDLVVYDVGAIPDPDMVAVDSVARLALTAIRMGCDVRLRLASCGWQQLLCLAGLGEAIPPTAASPLELGRQAELREQPLGVEEEVEPGDPPV